LVRLRIFVSSKTDELVEERKTIKSVFSPKVYDVFIFEDTGARTESASEVYTEEVLNCDIYIGIFKEKYSSATAEEYKLAAENDKEILAYVATDLKKRDVKLKRLLQKIRNRHKYKPYENIKKLIDYVKDDVEALRNRRFREAKSVKRSPFGSIVSVDVNSELVDGNIHEPIDISKLTERYIKDVSKGEIESCVNTLTTTMKDDVKQEVWRRLEELSKNTRIWKHQRIWDLMNKEILVSAPGKFFNYAVDILKRILLNAEKEIRPYPNPVATKARKDYLTKCKEILESVDIVWDFYHRTDFNQILKYITHEDERCAIWWAAWKKCAKDIRDSDQYRRNTFSLTNELENSTDKCKDSIRPERWSMIGAAGPPYLAQRAINLNI
jgi:hypothetical protein